MDPLARQIAALHNQGRLRVWSIVITVFGDLVQHRGGRISTARLGAVMGRIGVEQGALRTALSRLGRDGWVYSERIGRASHYRLSAQGLSRFAPATKRIYAPARDRPVTRWAMSLRLEPSGKQQVRLWPADEVAGRSDCLVIGELQKVSETFRAAQLSDDHRDALRALAADIKALENAELPAPLDAVAARVLLIHRWRRIVLRFPEIPAELMPGDSPLRDPRRAVGEAYRRLSEAAEAWMEGENDGLPAMHPKSDQTRRRFINRQRG